MTDTMVDAINLLLERLDQIIEQLGRIAVALEAGQ
jgi:hypothetical protein